MDIFNKNIVYKILCRYEEMFRLMKLNYFVLFLINVYIYIYIFINVFLPRLFALNKYSNKGIELLEFINVCLL